MERVINFAAGPAALPIQVLKRASDEMLNYGGTGMSVMEMSHRSDEYQRLFDHTVSLLRELMDIPENYEILMLQGGATGQFAAVPLNLLHTEADYCDSGHFAHSAMMEARKYGNVKCIASTEKQCYTRVPFYDELNISDHADYVYITSNNTIYGTAYPYIPETGAVPLVADMSSSILSGPCDVNRYGVIFAGAQKNIGPAGLTVVIIRRDLLGHARPETPSILNWTVMFQKGSMLNTPPTYAIYIAGLCFEWLKEQGGLSIIEKRNRLKAKLLYDFLDSSLLFHGIAEKNSRSLMNVTFRTDNPDMDMDFVRAATAAGLCNLKGHRIAGGMRASIYNAISPSDVERLVGFMSEYERRAYRKGE